MKISSLGCKHWRRDPPTPFRLRGHDHPQPVKVKGSRVDLPPDEKMNTRDAFCPFFPAR